MSGPLHTVHVRINDAATGEPTPVRIRITDAEGNYYPPLGRLTDFATGRNQDVGGNLLLGARAHACTEGSFEASLPAGPLALEVHKGFEYLPQRIETNLSPGKLTLRHTIERWIDLRAERWFSGDTRGHFVPPHAALLEAAAEDLAVVNLLVVETRVPGTHGREHAAVPNIDAFSGQVPALSRPGHLVVVNTLNTHPVLGTLGLLNCHRIVYPLSFGGPAGLDDWTLDAWCRQCHRKGGLVVWTRGWHADRGLGLGEPLADLILGQVDAYEVNYFEDSPFDVIPDWYALLNCGYRVPLVGGSGKDSNGQALGSMRTYARLLPGEEFTYRTWIEAVRAGRTFVTNGPLLRLAVQGQDPGSVIELAEGGQRVEVTAEADSVVPFDQLEVLFNGSVIAAASASGHPASARIELELPIAASGWLAARCRGQHAVPGRPAPQKVWAHTSPIHAQVAGQPPPCAPAAAEELMRQLDRTREWLENEGRFPGAKERQQLMEIIHTARLALRKDEG